MTAIAERISARGDVSPGRAVTYGIIFIVVGPFTFTIYDLTP